VARFLEAAAYEPNEAAWELLPFRFERFAPDRVLLTNMVGEHLYVSGDELELIVEKRLPTNSALVRRLRAKQIIRDGAEQFPLDLLALKTRTRYRRLAEFTSLHMFVVSLRCEHSCPYCQVSRQNANRDRYDMSPTTAERALALVFRSPSEQIKIEFQGGEPLLNFPVVEKVVLDAEQANRNAGKQLSFVIATNLALLDDEMLAFCDAHDIYISTSLDGPADLHNQNRPRPGNDSWERAVDGIRRIRETLGAHRVSALMTTTSASLDRAREIIDCYLEHGLNDIFLRPLSPYGFAIKTKAHAAYDAERWLEFYEQGLAYILALNADGIPIVERYAAIILKKMLSNDDPGYVDLASPARIGIGALLYNYDGDVYASDEARMLAEMGDTSFRLGNLHTDSYEQIMLSEALLAPLEQSFTLSAPMCSDCAFEPYCGSDPVFHHATSGDFLGHKPSSDFCRRNMHIFKLLLDYYEHDPNARSVFQRWAAQ
jgi:His-Xaa-Ser system radical SAM maturase HxsB